MINNDANLYKILNEDIFSENTVLEKMEKLRKMDKSHPDYHKLYQDIISVGEFEIK